MSQIKSNLENTPDIDRQIAESILRKVAESNRTSLEFFTDNSLLIGKLAGAMAERFQSGGRLFVMGNGGSACDAEHIAVEFMHPIFEKRKALPCVSLTTSNALLTAISNDTDFSRIFSLQLSQFAKPNDMVLAVSTSGMSANLVNGLKVAREIGALTIAFGGRDGGRLKDLADYSLVVASFSIHRIQESHTMLLHVLWDTIHLLAGEDDVI
jgi:D-sedoheptulose 7-phosphate isomerase